MPGVNAMLAEAKRWVDQGYVEGPGNNETPFGAWYGDQFEPWCDQFMSYCASASGNGDVVGRFEYCPSHVNFFKSCGQWGTSPKVGALVFYNWDGSGLADHVGIVVAFDAYTITTYEGNTSSGVAGSQSNGGGAYQRVRPRNGLIMGYGYPAYAADYVPVPVPTPALVGPAFPGRLLQLTSPMMHGNDVATAQAQLIKRGWSVPGGSDGWFGRATHDVIVAFQRDSTANGWPLTADGIVGEHTWSALFNRPVS